MTLSTGVPAADTAFTTTRLVEFHHCDPAGIVFYPRYFEMLNSVVGEWFGGRNGLAFPEMHEVERRGVPTVHLETNFMAASRHGEILTFEIAVRKVGGSSVDLLNTITCNGEIRFTCAQTLVFMDLDKVRAVRWPDPIRAALIDQLQPEPAE